MNTRIRLVLLGFFVAACCLPNLDAQAQSGLSRGPYLQLATPQSIYVVWRTQEAIEPVVHYAATQVKRMLTGSGRAPKSQMQLAIARELGLSEPPDPPDVADALAIAFCHFHLSKKTAEVS